MNQSAAVEIDLTTYESTTIATNLLADKLCNVEYTQNNQVQIITTNYIAGTVPTGNLIRLADKQIYQTTMLSDKLVSENKDLFFGNFLNGFVANNNIRYYKTTKEPDIFTRIVGNKIYEINDHLGNVRATISDRRLGENADLRSSVMYYPFGMPIANRTQSLNYRFGFNGKENDNEVNGFGMKLDFGAREYDAQTGRWWGVDPLNSKYPNVSSYIFCFNSPINLLDKDGMDTLFMMRGIMATSGKTGTYHMMKLQLIRDGKEIPLPKDFNNKIYMVYNNDANRLGQNDLDKKNSYELDWDLNYKGWKETPYAIVIKGAGGGGVRVHATNGCWGLNGCHGLSYKKPAIEGFNEDFLDNISKIETYKPITDIKSLYDNSKKDAELNDKSFKFILKINQVYADKHDIKLYVPKLLKEAKK